MQKLDDTITCMECGGIAHLLTILPEEDDLEEGDVLAYRCADCMERLDVVFGHTDDIQGVG